MIIRETGTIRSIGAITSGVSARGSEWARRDVVVEIPTSVSGGTYKALCLRAGTNRVADLDGLKPGDKVEIGYTVSSREWNGRWYTDVDLMFVEKVEKEATREPGPYAKPQAAEERQPLFNDDGSSTDPSFDLP